MNKLIDWWLGTDKEFREGMKVRPFGTGIKVVVVIIVISVAGLSSSWIIYFFGPNTTEHQYFSARTSVYARNYPADKNVIDLDSVGTLRPYRSFYNPDPAHRVSLVLNLPVTVLNKTMAPVSEGAAYSYVEEPDSQNIYDFDTSSVKKHEISLEGRTFVVTLYNIKDLSASETDVNYEYQFAVSEKP